MAADTILQGFGKLQSQINGIADGLQFQGTWNANIDEGGAGAAPGGTPTQLHQVVVKLHLEQQMQLQLMN